MLPEKQLAAALSKIAGVPMHGPFSRAVALQYLFPKPTPAPRVKSQPLWGMGSKLYGGRYTPKNSFETVYVAKDIVAALTEVTAIVTGHAGPPFTLATGPWTVIAIPGMLSSVLDLTMPAIVHALGSELPGTDCRLEVHSSANGRTSDTSSGPGLPQIETYSTLSVFRGAISAARVRVFGIWANRGESVSRESRMKLSVFGLLCGMLLVSMTLALRAQSKNEAESVCAELGKAPDTIPVGPADSKAGQVLLPIEVLGDGGTMVSRTLNVAPEDSDSVRALWLQVHGLCYTRQASVEINDEPWIHLSNETVIIAEPGKTFGGIGGGFATLVMTVPLARGAVVAGRNTVRFRFNESDGLSSGYRVLALDFLASDGHRVLSPNDFIEDNPGNWSPPLADATSIEKGRELWHNASLVASNLPHSPKIQARCADCHAQDGRDLKYFNFSNHSIVERSRFHGLSELAGEQIASYIRSLSLPNPGRPWNPPYQPGPGIDERPVSDWAAGAGLAWVLDHDTQALPYLVQQHSARLTMAAWHPDESESALRNLAQQITPEIFRPDGNLNSREIPIDLQLPDWSQWLPRVHPKDAWGSKFEESRFAQMYDGSATGNGNPKAGSRPSLRALLASAQTSGEKLHNVPSAFLQWSQARRGFLSRFVTAKTLRSPELSNKVYSTQLWQLVKTWEMMEEFGLEGRGRELFGPTGESRTWCNTVPADTAPSATHLSNGLGGVAGRALTNEYLTASWYELQILLNSGNHKHRGRHPVDWIYVVGEFHDFYGQTHEPEPTRLLVAVTKALQSTDPMLGPDNYSQGWRPERNVDPRIMINSEWTPIFKALPLEVRRAVTESMLSAWIDKMMQYPITKYLPLPVPPLDDYGLHSSYADFSGGKVWQAAQEFRAAGISEDLVERLRHWGIAYMDRAARLQYH